MLQSWWQHTLDAGFFSIFVYLEACLTEFFIPLMSTHELVISNKSILVISYLKLSKKKLNTILRLSDFTV